MRLVEEQIQELIAKDLTELAATNKIKKTYKNRYFLQQKTN